MMDPYVQYMYSYPHKTAYGPLEGIYLKDYIDKLSGSDNSLYFHIPFCQSKCGYCNLFSVAGQKKEFMEEYVDAMERQAAGLAEIMPDDVDFGDLTLGGGTPLMLSVRQLERIFQIAGEHMGFAGTGKHTIVETSPGQTTEEKIAVLKEHDVTRVSMGVQSFHDTELRTLKRSHCVQQVEEALKIIKGANFECLNLDLIYGIPGQTKESLMYSVERALEYEPEELFAYPLYIKEGTYLFHRGAVRPDMTYQMYVMVRDCLRDRGYVPFSMRRFVKDGRISRTAGCGFENTISIGCGGRSYIENLHFCTPFALKQSNCINILKNYIHQEDFKKVNHGYILSEEEQKRRYVIKNILFCCGIEEIEYEHCFENKLKQDFIILDDWIRQGYAAQTEGRIELTEKGFSLSDFLGPMLISDEVRQKMKRPVIG